ncbi:MAG: MarR family winged helix-turn-helix transcriptional regulator [Rubrimonas sp.]
MTGRPAEAADHVLAHVLQKAARAVTRLNDQPLRRLGLTSGQAFLLARVGRGDHPTVGRLAGDLAMDRSTVTALLRPLARDGVIRIAPAERDRRVRCVQLTERGSGLNTEAAAEVARLEAMLAARLPFAPAELRSRLEVIVSLASRERSAASGP